MPVPARSTGQGRAEQTNLLRIWLPLLLLLLAAALRLWRLNELPPGIYRDGAMYGLDSLSILAGDHPLFFREREPIFIYFQALLFAFAGHAVVVTRIASICFGMLTVALTYQLGRKMMGGDRRAGLLAMAAIATSYWHLDLSRLGFRAVSLPLFEGLACWSLLRMVEIFDSDSSAARKRRAAVLAGISFGLTLYTYLAARVFPLVITLFWLWWLLRRIRRIPLRQLVAQSAAYFLVAALVLLPLLLWVSGHSDALAERPEYIYVFAPENAGALQHEDPTLTPDAGPLRILLHQLQRAGGLYFIQGDLNQRHNLSGLPLFNPLSALFFIGGVLLCCRWVFRRDVSGDRAMLALLVLTVMLIPTILSVDAPHFLRALGLLPLAFCLPALAMISLYDAVRIRIAPPGRCFWSVAGNSFAVIWLCLLTISVARDFFIVMPSMPATYPAYEADATEVAGYLNSHHDELANAAPSYVGLSLYQHPTVKFIETQSLPKYWFFPVSGLVLPPQVGIQAGDQIIRPSSTLTRTQSYLLGFSNPETRAELSRIWPQGQIEQQLFDPNGVPYFTALQIPAGTLPAMAQVDHIVNVRFGDSLRLIGYTLAPASASPGLLHARLLWLIDGPAPVSDPDTRLVPYLHLLDNASQASGPLASAHWEEQVLPPLEWQPGTLFYSWADLPVPDGLTTGQYLLAAGAFRDPGLTRLPARTPDGKAIGDEIMLTPIKINGHPANIIPVETALAVELADHIRLNGYTLSGQPQASGKLALRLLWQATGSPSTNYTVFVHLLDTSGKLVAQRDQQPQDGHYPTGIWAQGDQIDDSYAIPLPRDLSAGTYTLEIGMYDNRTAKRLSIIQSNATTRANAIIIPVSIGGQ